MRCSPHGGRKGGVNDAGVVCGPIYTMTEIFQDPQYKAREMVDPEFGAYIGPGIVPKFSDTPGKVRWSGTWEDGSHNEEIYCGLLGLTDSELGRLQEDGVV
jgi:formyl-CoA transferase